MSSSKTQATATGQQKIVPKFNPFPGLRPFSIEESHLFFGREGQSDEILQNLAENRFVAVMGASGSGKSSLIYCGLVPILYGGFITNAGSDWTIFKTRPGSSPIDNMAEAIVSPDIKSKEDREIQKNVNSTILRSSSLGLIEAIKGLRKENENVLLIIDQFEELFRYKNSIEEDVNSVNESSAFVKLFLSAIRQSEVPIYVVLTMRSDFIGDCAQFHELTRAINDSNYLIPRMTRDDFKNAVIGPVAVGGGEISGRLTQQLLNDVGDNQDQLPILQHALMRTWDYWIKNRDSDLEPLDVEHYESIGRMKSALSEHANEAYDELTENGKQICESMFKTLTEKGGDNRGIRHPTQITKIAEIAHASVPEVAEVVETFRKVGRSFLMPSSEIPISNETVVDISHESLMRIWDRLIVWVDDESNAVNMYLRLSESAQLYQEGKTGLWRPPDLQLAVNWREKQQPTLTWAQRFNPAFERTMVYLETSEKEFIAEEENKVKLQKRALRRTRIFAVVLGSAAIVSIAIMLWAFALKQEADTQKLLAVQAQEEAVKEREEALKQKKYADEQKELAEEQRKIATEKEQAAQESARIAKAAQAEALENLTEAKRQELIAKRQTEEAERERERAKASADDAKRQKDIAVESQQNANKLRMISIAQSMAVKSLQIKKDLNKKALVAYQAYQFNEEYEGNENNPDIYSGLYHTLKYTNDEEYNSLTGHTAAVRSMAYSSDGSKLFTAGSDGRIIQWNMNNNNGEHTVLMNNKASINRCLDISKNDRWLAVGTGKSVQLIELTSTKSPVYLSGHRDVVWSVAFSKDGKKLVTSAADSTVRLWDIGTGDNTIIAKVDSRVKSISLSSDDKYVIGGTENGKVIKWITSSENDPGKVIYEEKNDPIYSVAISNDNTMYATGDLQGTVRLYDMGTDELVESLSGHDARINDLQFSPDNSRLASASYDGKIQLWNTDDLNYQPIVLDDHSSWVWSLAFSPDGSNLISGCVDRLIRKYPTHSYMMASQMCSKITRNISKKEWDRYVGEDIDYERTCAELPEGEGVIIINQQ